jgi:PAS domain S-box-containing protein
MPVSATFRSGDALFVYDNDMTVVAWNEAAERLTGVPAEEAVGRPCWDVLHGEDERGGVVCHPGCSGARLAREGFPVPCHRLFIPAPGGRKRLSITTISVRPEHGEPLVVQVMRNGATLPKAGSQPPPALTPRQREVLGLIAEGVPAKVIALRLGIAEPTVRNHIRAILVELGCHSQLEAVAEARRRGVL